MKHGEGLLPHAFLIPTLDPDFRRCVNCRATARVVQPRPAPAVRSSPTSVEAARAIEGSQRQRTRVIVWGAFLAATDGLTDEEGIAVTGLDPSTYRPRRIELVADGLVIDSKTTRKTRSGRDAVVWKKA